jgi:hypothetical protein
VMVSRILAVSRSDTDFQPLKLWYLVVAEACCLALGCRITSGQQIPALLLCLFLVFSKCHRPFIGESQSGNLERRRYLTSNHRHIIAGLSRCWEGFPHRYLSRNLGSFVSDLPQTHQSPRPPLRWPPSAVVIV